MDNKFIHYYYYTLCFFLILIVFNENNNIIAVPIVPSNPSLYKRGPTDGEWKTIGNTGVLAMHISLVSYNKIIMIDKDQKNALKQSNGQSAIVALYNLDDNTVVPIDSHTDSFCSGGSWDGNGTLFNSGGEQHNVGAPIATGNQAIRKYIPPGTTIQELDSVMTTKRWYPTVLTLPNGKVLVMGGSTGGTAIGTAKLNNPTYEIWSDADITGTTPITFNFLIETLPYNLYPILHVVPNEAGKNLIFVFANQKSIIYDLDAQALIKTLPILPGSPRTYPLTGTSAFLPLRASLSYKPEVMICGGGSAQNPQAVAEASCGRLDILDDTATWQIDNFGGMGRVMPDSVILADGNILFVNGAGKGYAGFRKGPLANAIWVSNDPVLAPVLYNVAAKTYTTLAASTIPRMYHSTATLIPDGSVFIGGSNPQPSVVTDPTALYPTEYRAEIFTPPYLLTGANRATIMTIDGVTINQDVTQIVHYQASINVVVQYTSTTTPTFVVVLQHTGFTTHSSVMSQRYVELVTQPATLVTGATDQYTIPVALPFNPTLLCPGPQWLNVLVDGIPAVKAARLILN